MTDSIKETNLKKMPQEDPEEKNPQIRSGDFRATSYVVLFIGAVFVINAMETGSYRTPWSVAIITILAGLGLFGYSWYLKSRKQ